ncbi:uncharacterized protein BXZ73DRAFT_97392 [Epithele typhae]|uniref:uncharacterized protein n=1 Tax=Epithele typhae TaxID=378194 RepID=UPI002007510E|nr:uncharacterized protein BXZ73DRAFT_97392 [Epithele typhae]KAH9943349.1 hypothetical protein BXZ73DRAFT_97392 [Epithele typhae]
MSLTTVFLGNLPDRVQTSEIDQCLSAYGNISTITRKTGGQSPWHLSPLCNTNVLTPLFSKAAHNVVKAFHRKRFLGLNIFTLETDLIRFGAQFGGDVVGCTIGYREGTITYANQEDALNAERWLAGLNLHGSVLRLRRTLGKPPSTPHDQQDDAPFMHKLLGADVTTAYISSLLAILKTETIS